MISETDFYESVRDLAGLSVVHSDFVVVTSEDSGRSLYEPLIPLLRRVKAIASVDVMFVAQFLDETPAVRYRRPGPSTAFARPDPAEAEYGAMLIARAGAARSPSGCLAAPVVADDGRDFGTVCCHPGPSGAKPEVDLAGVLRSTARILALALSRGTGTAQEDDAEAVSA